MEWGLLETNLIWTNKSERKGKRAKHYIHSCTLLCRRSACILAVSRFNTAKTYSTYISSTSKEVQHFHACIFTFVTIHTLVLGRFSSHVTETRTWVIHVKWMKGIHVAMLCLVTRNKQKHEPKGPNLVKDEATGA